MGKGGQKSLRQRGGSTSPASEGPGMPLKRLPADKPPFTVGTLRNAIPKHCFQRSLLLSFAYLVADLIMAASLYAASTYIDTPAVPTWARYILWPAYWWAQGAVCTGIWVISHECGHGAFSDYAVVNDTVGFVFHSILLVPYFSWKYSHRRHHSNTGSTDKDEVFVPSAREDPESHGGEFEYFAPVRAMYLFFTLTIGWPLYLTTNIAGRPYPKFANHFNPWSPIFNNRERFWILVSDLGLGAVFYGLYALQQAFGTEWLVKTYVVPYLVVNMWLVMITLLQHTHPALPHFDSQEWDWLRGALSTVDRSYGLLDYFHHHIADTHVAHHLFSTMPHYHAEEATRAIKPILGDYYLFDRTPIHKALWRDWSICSFIAPDKGGNKGVLWYRTARY